MTLKIGVVGTRGIPNNYGGFERFIEVLVSNEIFDDCCEFIIYATEQENFQYKHNVQVRYAGTSKDTNPLKYYVLSILKASKECDVILCCGVGGSIFSLFPRIVGKRIVTNVDGLEWRRAKWSKLGRLLVWLFYQPVFLFSNLIIADAKALLRYIPKVYHNKTRYIGYQIPSNIAVVPLDVNEYPDEFALCVCRLEPENNVEMIINGHIASDSTLPLLIVGNTNTRHFNDNLRRYENSVTFLGGIYNLDQLNMLRTNCAIYYHGHSVGGTNPSLLEAMVYVQGILVCHDNEFNREVTSDAAVYFKNAQDLTVTVNNLNNEMKQFFPLEDYQDDLIARKYKDVFFAK